MTVQKPYIIKWSLFIALLTGLLLSTNALRAQILAKAEERVEAGEPLSDMAFLAGKNLTITAKSTDDIFAAGDDISLHNTQADHMVAVGRKIIMTDITFNDVIIAGGDVHFINGVITDDLVAVGADLKFNSEATIKGSAVLTGADITLNAPIGAELRAAARRLWITADIGGDAHLVGENITIGPNVTIEGDLRYRAQTLGLDPNATIKGEIIRLPPPQQTSVEQWGAKTAAAAAIFSLALLIGITILVIAIVLTLPGLMERSANMIQVKPFTTFGLGFLIIAAAPVTIAFLFTTVIGVPLALLVMAIYVSVAPFAIASFIYFISMHARRITLKPKQETPGPTSRVMWISSFAVVLLLLGLIPIAGGFIWFIAYIIGMGAVMTCGGKALAHA